MRGGCDGRDLGAGRTKALIAAPFLAVLLAGCGSGALSNVSLSSLNIFDSNKATQSASADGTPAEPADIECPGVAVRAGASTLMIGDNSKGAETGALNLRYQGTIVRTARECNVAGGVMTMKVGVEGRVITGPAGGPGSIDVPLRIAVVHEGVNPKPIISKFARIPVTVANDSDRVNFVHVESDISFPMPVPAGEIDSYVVYVGFDTLAAQEKKAPPARRKPAARPAKPKQS